MLRIVVGIVGYLILNSLVEKPLKKKRIFISHSWSKSSDDYLKLIRKFKKEKIPFFNHSIPVDRPFDETKVKELENVFRKQIIYCSKVFVLAKRGIKDNTFVKTEIKIAKQLNKKIIAIKPYGQKGIPGFIRKNSDLVITANSKSLKKAFNL